MPSNGYRTLLRTVRLRSVLKYLGYLFLSLIGLALVPAVFAFAQGEYDAAGRLIAAAAVLGTLGWLLGRIHAPSEMETNEALVITAVAFLAGASIMTWPLMGPGTGFIDALFESVSAITTTGLSTLPADNRLTATHLFTRAWMQWYGGMVIIVLAVALMLPPGGASRSMAGSDVMAEDLVGSARYRARTTLLTYALMTVAGMVVLLALGVPAFDAVAHALAAISTGGFATHPDSLAAFDSRPVRWVIIGLSLLGALSFTLYHRAWRLGWHETVTDAGLRGVLAAFALTTVCLAGFMALSGRHWTTIVDHAPLMAASAQATAGFTTMAVSDLDPASKVVTIIAMVIGGDAGSTAGGIKITRWLLILQMVRLTMARTALPDRAVTTLRLDGQTVDDRHVQRILSIVFLFGAVILVSWLAFLAYGYPALDSLFDIVSATATTGLSTGVTGASLATPLKLLLCFDMLAGRVEVLALVTLFYPATWFTRRTEAT